MFDSDALEQLKRDVRETTARDRSLLENLLADVEVLRGQSVRIQPRTISSISLVASDGGNNKAEFNPFELQIVRVVDSHGAELLSKVVSPQTDLDALANWHTDSERPNDALGLLMKDLGCATLHDLSPMLNNSRKSRGWPLVYRDLCEWAVLYQLITTNQWGTDTLIVRDGLLRSKIFSKDLFIVMYRRILKAIEEVRRTRHRDLYLVGIAKHSEVHQRYAMAMSVQQVLPAGHPFYVSVPMSLQDKVYLWPEYIRSPGTQAGDGEDPKYNAGVMHFVRFGRSASDPVWTADLLEGQQLQAQRVFGSLLGDAVDGFPVPYYPMCLQRADQHARVAGLDMSILRDELARSVRGLLEDPTRQHILDGLQLSYTDIAARRYE